MLNYKIYTIDWLRIICADTWWNSVTCQFFARAWSINETKENNGIAHFLEHVFFKWTQKYPTAQLLSEAVESFGWEMNAYTSHDRASYYVKSWKTNWLQSLETLADIIVNPLFPAEELEKEKWVVIQEMAMYRDDPRSLVWDARWIWYYGDNQYGRPVLWDEQTVWAISRENIIGFKNTHYTRQNSVLIISWNLPEHQTIIDYATKYFADLPQWIEIWLVPLKHTLPTQTSDKIIKWTEQNHLIIAWPWYERWTPESFAFELANKVIGWTMFSRLFQQIREELWLCYYVYSSQSPWDIFPGLFYIKAWLQKESFKAAQEKISEIMTQISQWTITAHELELARGNKIWSWEIGLETSDQIAEYIGWSLLIHNKIRSIDEIVAWYKAVTLEEVNEVTKILDPKNLFTYWIE
jgi:predicted Zn-dependent peptidase